MLGFCRAILLGSEKPQLKDNIQCYSAVTRSSVQHSVNEHVKKGSGVSMQVLSYVTFKFVFCHRQTNWGLLNSCETCRVQKSLGSKFIYVIPLHNRADSLWLTFIYLQDIVSPWYRRNRHVWLTWIQIQIAISFLGWELLQTYTTTKKVILIKMICLSMAWLSQYRNENSARRQFGNPLSNKNSIGAYIPGAIGFLSCKVSRGVWCHDRTSDGINIVSKNDTAICKM